MTGPKGNSQFCFPETLNVPRGEGKWNIKVDGPAIKTFVISSNSQIEKKNRKFDEIVRLTPTGLQLNHGFKEHFLIMWESKGQVLFPWDLVSFDPRHVTRAPPTRETYLS